MRQILCIGIWSQILECHPGNALLANGRSKLMAFSSGMRLSDMLLLIPVGYKLQGFVGAVCGYAVSEMLRYGFSAWAISRHGPHIGKFDLSLTLIGSSTVLIGHWMQSSTMMSDSNRAAVSVSILFVFAMWSLPLVPLRKISS